MPFLPLDEVSFDREARTLWLDNVERLEPSPPAFLHEFSVVVDVELRNGRGYLVLLVNPNNLHMQQPQ